MPTSRTRDLLRSVAVPVLVVLAWEGLSRAGVINPMILPSPSRVLLRWFNYLKPAQPYNLAGGSRLAWIVSGELPHDAVSSLYRVIVGFLIGTGLALPLGLAMGVR